ncbi:T9SS C-terminal target domain-containing protein [Chitinophaga silvatica]|uniref:T9SS C-terminal target domain-containing protein n=1 Tax=Chitinophaga silvatica TaxID=2282649 RepID=A0A3E1Y4G6_9BACT|nr:PKD domain-containing protein [Chitinophaga silvatica]RFS19571.1 T9SS C-terminal target domain-containing protein [Chitinophaga silvatica]
MNNRFFPKGIHPLNTCSWFVLVVILVGWCNLAIGQTFTAKSFNEASMSNIKGYYEYLPANYNPADGKKYPLIIFFHGNGELASTSPLSSVLRNGLPQKINDGLFPKSFTVNNQEFSFIVACPQFNTWPGSADATKFKDWLVSKYNVDVNRIYITGLSMGGGETWGALCENGGSKAFAAAVTVCGYYPPTPELAQIVATNKTPVWALHNKTDPNSDPNWSINWVKYINSSNPAPVVPAKLTIFNKDGHDAWSQAYDPLYKENGMNIYEWMLQYSLGGTSNPPANTGGKRIVVPMSNSSNGRAEIYYPDAMTTFKVQPGDTLCIAAGEYESVYLGNLTGTPEKPIVITNCGGLVKLGVRNQTTAAVFNAPTCRYIEISGSGDKNYEYGFDINGTNINGLKIFGITFGLGSSDFDVHHLYIHDGNILLQAKTLQTCARPEFLEGSFVMKNVKIHNLKCRNSEGEGFYIGNTHYFWNDGACTNLRSHWIENLWVYNNDLENIGADGIQIAMAKNGDNRVFNNRLVNYGTTKNEAQGYGILLGSGCSMKVYNNFVKTGFMPGITVFGSGVNDVFNNVISDIYTEGINVADKIPANTTPDLFPPPTANIYNNTIVGTDGGKDAMKVYAYQTTIGHQVYNNLMIQNGTPYDYPGTGMYIKGAEPIKLTASNNLCYSTAQAAGVVDSASANFRLLATSPALNAGRDMSDFNLKTDFDGTARPQQNIYDVGAFEGISNSQPQPPVANAGSNITITLPTSSVTLNGNASTPAPGSSISKYNWVKTSGPSSGTITTATAATTTVTGLTAGTYVYTLTVTDKNGLTSSASVTVIVNEALKAPVANAGSNITITLPTSSVTLNGSASTPAPGSSISKYNWVKTSGPSSGTITTATAATTTVTGLTAGTYVYTLTVTDKNGLTNSASVTVIVNEALKAPVANAGNNVTITLPESTITLDASASTPAPGSSIDKVNWIKVSGPSAGTITSPAATQTTVTSLTIAGTYVFQVTVTDKNGLSASATVNITVNPANIPPVANAGNDQTIVLPTNTTVLDGSLSTDADGRIVSWSWTKTSGPAGGLISTPGLPATEIRQLQEGIYVFTLSVKDDKGATATATVKVTVLPASTNPPDQPPVAATRGDKTIQLPENVVFADGSLSYDLKNTIVNYEWAQLSGPATAVITSQGQSQTYLTGLKEGVYQFKLTVTNDLQLTGITTFTVTVLPPVVDHVGDTVILFPNPATTLLRLKVGRSGSEILNLFIYDIYGRRVYQNVYSNAGSFQIELPITNLPKGMYFIELLDNSKRFYWKGRFIKAAE